MCPTHRTDPQNHSSRKGKKGVRRREVREAKKKHKEEECTSRTAPITKDGDDQKQAKKAKKDGNLQKNYAIINHATCLPSTQPPKQELIDRVRLKVQEAKAAVVNVKIERNQQEDAGNSEQQSLT